MTRPQDLIREKPAAARVRTGLGSSWGARAPTNRAADPPGRNHRARWEDMLKRGERFETTGDLLCKGHEAEQKGSDGCDEPGQQPGSRRRPARSVPRSPAWALAAPGPKEQGRPAADSASGNWASSLRGSAWTDGGWGRPWRARPARREATGHASPVERPVSPRTNQRIDPQQDWARRREQPSRPRPPAASATARRRRLVPTRPSSGGAGPDRVRTTVVASGAEANPRGADGGRDLRARVPRASRSVAAVPAGMVTAAETADGALFEPGGNVRAFNPSASGARRGEGVGPREGPTSRCPGALRLPSGEGPAARSRRSAAMEPGPPATARHAA
jgi:hypothetical protein